MYVKQKHFTEKCLEKTLKNVFEQKHLKSVLCF